MYHINHHKQNKRHSKTNVRKANSKVENLHKKIEYFFDLIISKKYLDNIDKKIYTDYSY
jgi:hypothetical protein